MNRKILVIDDDVTTLNMLDHYLRFGENGTHQIIKAKNGQEGLNLFRKHHADIDVVLLDRMMPVLSGPEFLRKRNLDKDLKNIPVIMLTVCSGREEVLEGFRLGVYHYITKPCAPTILNSIVHSAISFYSKQSELLAEIHNSQTLFRYANRAEFMIKDLTDVDLISVSLARLFPNPDKVVLGISEMLTNAVEHGNLGISYEEKTQLNIECKWRDEIEKRLKAPENHHKNVVVYYEKNEEEIILNIRDQGIGFEYEKYLEFDPSRSTHNHGRGIAFANKISFDGLQFVGSGNEVKCLVKLN